MRDIRLTGSIALQTSARARTSSRKLSNHHSDFIPALTAAKPQRSFELICAGSFQRDQTSEFLICDVAGG
jgi:hypothetical protein